MEVGCIIFVRCSATVCKPTLESTARKKKGLLSGMPSKLDLRINTHLTTLLSYQHFYMADVTGDLGRGVQVYISSECIPDRNSGVGYLECRYNLPYVLFGTGRKLFNSEPIT